MFFHFFLDPSKLWWLFICLPLGLFLWNARAKVIKRLALLVDNPADFKRRRSMGLPLLIVGLFIIGLARPHLGFKEISIRSTRQDLLILFDISASMRVRDVSPDRLEFSKRKLYDLLELTKSKTPGTNIGIVLFAGEAYLYCPPTADYSTVQTFVSSIDTSLISAAGSSLNSAFAEAQRSLNEMGSRDPIILLITDGEDEDLVVTQAKEALSTADATLFVLGVGTEAGGPIPWTRGSYLRDRNGATVVSKLEQDSLKVLAHELGGTYLQAVLSDADLRSLPHLRPRTPSSAGLSAGSEETIRVYDEIGPLLVLVSLLLLAFAFIRRSAPFVCIFVLATSGMTVPVPLQADQNAETFISPEHHGSAHDAYKLYQSGEYDQALPLFEHHFGQNPSDRKLAQAYASTLYKLGDFERSSEVFESLSHSENAKQKYENLHNLGNAQFMLQDYKAAIEKYEAALKLNSSAEDTKHNLELAKQLLEQSEEKQKKQESKEDSQAQKNEEDRQDPSDKQQEQQNDSEEESSESPQPQQQDGDQEDKTAAEDEQKAQSGEEQSSESSQEAAEQGDRDEQTEGEESVSNNSHPEHSEQKLSQGEAQAWLDSLPDAPVVLGRRVGENTSRSRNPW